MIFEILTYSIFLANVIMFPNFQDSDSVNVFKRFDNNSNRVQMSFVGDVMVHSPQIPAQYDKVKREYDFNNNFQYVKKYIESSDIAVCNFETTLAGKAKGYEGYPLFNSPDALLDALKSAGFDVISLANNHMLDRGSYGLNRTMDMVEKDNLISLGARMNEVDKDYMILEVKNVRIGITSYTYGKKINGKDTINGNFIPKESINIINRFDYETLGIDLEKMKRTIDDMKANGAECIIFGLHWGNEYEEKPNSYQQAIAEFLCKNGVNVIIGSHPHVLQKFDVIEVDGHKTHVFYSLGNFLSNQRYELMNQRDSENGIIVQFSAEINDNGEVNISDVTYVPTWVNKYYNSGKWVYEVLPLNEPLSNFKLDYKDNEWRAQNAIKMIRKVVASGNMSVKETPPVAP